jgi:putative ABC transport system permease protein
VAVISESLARRVWRNQEDAIGKRIKFGVDDPMNEQPWLTVVGRCRRCESETHQKSSPFGALYYSTYRVDTMDVVVRTSAHPLSLASALRHEVSQLDRNLPAGDIKTVDQILNESLSAERFRTWLLSSFAIAAMLATLGIAGLLAYNAAQRMQEFGLRVRIGSKTSNLLAWCCGIVCGCPAQALRWD